MTGHILRISHKNISHCMKNNAGLKLVICVADVEKRSIDVMRYIREYRRDDSISLQSGDDEAFESEIWRNSRGVKISV